MSRTRAVAVVGAGRAALALVPALADAGVPIAAVAARSRPAAARLRRAVPSVAVVRHAADAARAADVVLLAVRDREIAPLAGSLAAARRWRGVVALHLAGALGPDQLAPLARVGAATGVFHPLQSLGIPGGARLAGSGVRLEGDRGALAAGRSLARALGLTPLVTRTPPGADGRAAYHAAASLVGNDLIALLEVAGELLARAGFSRRSAGAALDALARGTLDNVRAAGVDRALTGPVVRGDAEIVIRHLRAIARVSRPVSTAHARLSERLVEIAVRAGRLDVRAARELAAALRAADARRGGGSRRGPTV